MSPTVHLTSAASLAFAFILTGCTSQPPRKSVEDDFEKKLKCAGMLGKLREDAEHDQLQAEAYVRTFYSPRLSACVAEKYTLYFPDNKVPESLEVIDLSSNRVLWSDQVQCKVRPYGMSDPPKSEYKCSDYHWNVENQLQEYVKTSHLEEP